MSVPDRELHGHVTKCYICDGERERFGQIPKELIPIYDHKQILYVHRDCAFDAIMRYLRFRNLKEAWRKAFD